MSSFEIDRFVEDEAQPRQRLSTRFAAVERHHQNTHAIQRNDRRREAELAIAEEGRKLVEQLARFERYARVTTEAKFRLHRAKKESQILQDDDSELRAKFALLDDELLQRFRLDLQQDD